VGEKKLKGVRVPEKLSSRKKQVSQKWGDPDHKLGEHTSQKRGKNRKDKKSNATTQKTKNQVKKTNVLNSQAGPGTSQTPKASENPPKAF